MLSQVPLYIPGLSGLSRVTIAPWHRLRLLQVDRGGNCQFLLALGLGSGLAQAFGRVSGDRRCKIAQA